MLKKENIWINKINSFNIHHRLSTRKTKRFKKVPFMIATKFGGKHREKKNNVQIWGKPLSDIKKDK